MTNYEIRPIESDHIMNYRIKAPLATLSETSKSEKRLTITSWNHGPDKLDLRIWLTDYDDPKPGKGMTLTDEEAAILLTALKGYFKGKTKREEQLLD